MSEKIDRLQELLLSEDFGADVPLSMLGRELPNTEPTLSPIHAMIANQKAQDDFLIMMMTGGPGKIPAKSAINVGMQRFMLPAKEFNRHIKTRTERYRPNIPPPTAEAAKRQDMINEAAKKSLEMQYRLSHFKPPSPKPTFYGYDLTKYYTPQEIANLKFGSDTAGNTAGLGPLYQKALEQIRKSEDLIRDTIGMKNPTGQIRQADAMKAAALKEIERIRKAGNGKLPDLMPDKLTTEQIQKAMLDEGLGSLKT